MTMTQKTERLSREKRRKRLEDAISYAVNRGGVKAAADKFGLTPRHIYNKAREVGHDLKYREYHNDSFRQAQIAVWLLNGKDPDSIANHFGLGRQYIVAIAKAVRDEQEKLK